MVIQRIQSLMLLVAVILTALFCLTPFAHIPADDGSMTAVFVRDAPVLLTVNILIAVLLFLVIFLYKNLRLQMRMTILSLVLLCASIVTCGFIMFARLPEAEPVLLGGVLLLVLAAAFAVLAYRGMAADRRRLSAADRLR